MPKFYRKQQVVEAFQWDGCVDNTLGFPDWMVEAVRTRTAWLAKSEDYGPEIFFNNGFVTFIARPGDWIVRDEEGHINRCHDHMFTKVYGYDDKQPENNKRLLELLEHAVKVADEWYDDGHGGRIEGDALIDEARALVSSGNKERIYGKDAEG